ncbi:MAG TPA: hypothetical protein P5120_05640 [Spirochaetota bacterium]|nr:hypothetical protein [Spirochaetota bacterium]HPF05348.1 hypothetical protein [Spirochaetota bacterium]HPJ41778.1 hypothetical protein [Spirochaetota bacterium]HPR39168.1 hypothetical protein [Spirochaetota bacterium]HRX46982.1 hypothetical protein [Spirochaetota bacterium]
MKNDIVDKVFKRIVAHNQSMNLDSIPHSDTFQNEIMSLYGLPKNELDVILSILKESHKVLIMEIAKEEPRKNLDKISGYVDADLHTIQKLKEIFYNALVAEYEKEYHKKKTAGQIIKELIPRLSYINHTPVGKFLNKALMLDEFERHVEKNYREFTEEWKDENYTVQLSVNEEFIKNIGSEKKKSLSAKETESVPAAVKPAVSKRAVDSPLHQEYQNQNSSESIAKMLQIYGVDFFYRVNLRKYNFEIIEQAIDSGIITRRQDLAGLKEMLKQMRSHFGIDSELEKYYDDIMNLDRKVSRSISFLKK